MASPLHTYASMHWPKVSSTYHSVSERYCGPFILCNKMQPRYNHFGALLENEQKFIQCTIVQTSVEAAVSVEHVAEAKRHCSDPLYIILWLSYSCINTGKNWMYPTWVHSYIICT